MKEVKIMISVIALGAATMAMVRPVSQSEKFAVELISSLRYGSIDNFEALFPTVEEFLQVMERNKDFYGDNLEAAKQEFIDEYNHRIGPELVDSFRQIRTAAHQENIDWHEDSLLRIVVGEDPYSSTMTIYFSSKGETHRLLIEKVLRLNGRWKASGKIKLAQP